MKIKINNLPKLLTETDKAKRILQEELYLARQVLGERLVARVVLNITNATPHPPINSGLMMAGIHATVAPATPTVTVAPSPVTLEYAIVMEVGREPGKWPPFKAIHKWVKKKFRKKSKDWFHQRVGGNPKRSKAKMVETYSFLVQRKIGTKGIEGRWFFKRTRKQVKQVAQEVIQVAVNKAVARLEALK